MPSSANNFLLTTSSPDLPFTSFPLSESTMATTPEKTPAQTAAATLLSTMTHSSLKASPDQQIHLPPPLLGDLPATAAALLAIDKQNSQTVSFAESFPGFHPGDTGVCFMRLLRSTFGFVNLCGSEGFFGTKPPTLYNIRTGVSPSDTEAMVFGDIKVPGLGSSVTMKIGIDFGSPIPCLVISGTCEQRHLAAVNGVLASLKRDLPTLSIYRNKAVRVSWQWQRDGDDYSLSDHAPTFLDLSRSNYNNIVLTDEATRQVAANLFLPITQGENWIKFGFSRKSGVLMQGPPGCGKTETLLKVANLCLSHSRTYIQCSSVEDLEAATHMALNYQPCVVAVEDIDKAVQGRTISIDAILNIIDGTETKNRDILFVATTNDVDSITDAMLRPGRLGDGFIYMGPPDEIAVGRLIKITAGPSLQPGTDLTEACTVMAGSLPAVIVATVQAARKYALVRTGMSSDCITSSDLIDAFSERTSQIRLLTRPKPDNRSQPEKAASITAEALNNIASRLASLPSLTT